MPIHDWTRVDAGVFHHFHLCWTTALARALNAGLLPPGYYAMGEQVTGPGNPDALVLQFSGGPLDGAAPAGGVALAAAPPRVRVSDAADEAVYARRTRSVTVRRTNGDRVVAVIEIVSPGNKDSRHALRAFVTKAVEFLRAGVHLLVLDLFPPGRRDPHGIHPAIWSEFADRPFELPPDKPLTLAGYAAGSPVRAFVDPVGVGDRLPDMPLFLSPESYINVPLDPTYQAAWAEVPARWQLVLDPPAGPR